MIPLSPSQQHRKACFAASWYEADPVLLEKQLTDFFQKAAPTIEAASNHSSVVALVSPHAGYFFSGEVAACAYKAVKDQKIKRIFLLGPSHYVALRGIALSVATAFETPLGNLSVDIETVSALEKSPLFITHEAAHQREHSLEMQLPFLKKLFGKASIVPLLVGKLSGSEIEQASKALKSLLQSEDLIVVSSDFTHYGPRFGYTPFQKDVKENIRHLDEEAYSYLAKLDWKGFLAFQQKTGATICGLYPLALMLALLPSQAHTSLLKYETSQDKTAADPDHSVSYMALIFSMN